MQKFDFVTSKNVSLVTKTSYENKCFSVLYFSAVGQVLKAVVSERISYIRNVSESELIVSCVCLFVCLFVCLSVSRKSDCKTSNKS
jgi:hypothetical protein